MNTTRRLATGPMLRRALRRVRRPYVVVWGNCQAEAIRSLLMDHRGFREQYDSVRLPGVHEIRPSDVSTIHDLVRNAALIVAQPVRENYRDMPLGTSQVLRGSSAAHEVTFAPLYYEGLHPYLAYVHASGALGTPAPRTGGYHDLRWIAFAASGARSYGEWWARNRPSDEALVENARCSLKELTRREENVDARVSADITALGTTSFWTLNHPSNALLGKVVDFVVSSVGLSPDQTRGPERLGSLRAPVHGEVRTALGFAWVPNSSSWGGRRSVSDAGVRGAHLNYYEQSPDVLRVALMEHDEKLTRLGMI